MANNIIVPIPTELKSIKSELIFGLTKRQVVGFGIAVGIVVPSFLLLKKINISVAMYGSFIIGVPIIFMTMFKKDKLTAENWLKNIIEYNFIFEEKSLYRVTPKNREVAVARGFINDDKKKKPISSVQRSNQSKKK